MSIDARKKSTRGRPPVDTEEVRARIHRRLLDRLDAWISAQPDPKPSRSEAIRRILEKALKG
jgi:metal-responsive CopG/Arc/MetJ family transcriptional regulator